MLLLLVLASAFAPPVKAGPPRTEGELHYCVIDLRHEHLRGFFSDTSGHRFGSIAALDAWLSQSHEHIVCATNGGIFGKDGAPLGWFVADGVQLFAINRQSHAYGNFYLQPNGALRIANGTAAIVATAELLPREEDDVSQVELGVQSGPLLIVDGRINALFDPASTSRYTRNAVCLRDAHTVLLAYSSTPLTFYQFALALVGLSCQQALYLDGNLSQLSPDAAPLVAAQRETLSVILAVTAKDPA